MKTLRNQVSARSGLTLIELVVVLAVLVALAGLIIGNFPGIIRKASRSSGATSVQDLSRAVQYSYTTTLKYPTGFDSLLETATTLYNKLPPTSTNAGIYAGAQLTPGTISAPEGAALVKIGLTNSLRHTAAVSTDVTWTSTLPGQTAYSFDNAANLSVTTINSTVAYSVFKADTNNFSAKKWLIFGVGAGCSLVGPNATILEAPVHYGADASQNPKDYYQRYAVCFEVDSSGSTIIARYIGAAAIEGDGLTATDVNVKEYWKN
ncbi:MAG: prepilin-type N-terminal cleavage/methylation domain-containing protein [Pedosphaera sp.]|nr:prepilin-type N-terminal cleavage/methylation domain-containing protein [Pedosphaera sp.]